MLCIVGLLQLLQVPRLLLAICLVSTLVRPAICQGEDFSRDVLRTSFGVQFRHVASAMLVSDEYKQMFHLELPPKNLSKSLKDPFLQCVLNTSTSHETKMYMGSQCGDHLPFNQFLSELHHDYASKLDSTINAIYNLFPPYNVLQNRQTRRSPFDFVGHGLSWLTGVSTMSDLNDLKQTILKMIADTSKISGRVNQQVSDLTSMVQITNSRIEKIMHNVLQKNQVLEDIAVHYGRSLQSLANFTLILLRKVHLTNKLSIDLTDNLHSMEHVASGSLVPNLITPFVLGNVITHIQNYLKTNFPNFTLISNSKSLYYSQSDCVSVRYNNKIVIMKKFPLTNWNQRFSIYKVENFNIPISNNNSHATILTNLPNYVAISEDHKYYFQFDHKPVVKHEMLYTDNIPLQISNRTCIIALYQNNAVQITQLCTSVFLPSGLKSLIMRLDAIQILLIKIPKYTLILPNGSLIISEGCQSFCIKTIPCGSMIKTTQHVLPPHISDCTNITHQESIVFPINYPLLSAFFQQNELEISSKNMNLDKELNLVLPSIEFLKLNSSKILEEDKKVKLNLNSLAESISKEQNLFESDLHALKYDILANSQNPDTFDFKSWKDILLIVTTIVQILCFTMIIVLFWKLYKLNALILLNGINPVNSLNVSIPTRLIHDKFRSTKSTTLLPTTTAKPIPLFDIHFDFENSTKMFQILLFLIITILFMLVVYKLYTKSKFRTIHWTTTLFFNFSSESTIISLQGQTLPDHVDTFTFSSEHAISSVQLVGCLFPTLLLNWDFQIKHAFMTENIPFQKYIRLNWYQAFQLRTILKSRKSL